MEIGFIEELLPWLATDLCLVVQAEDVTEAVATTPGSAERETTTLFSVLKAFLPTLFSPSRFKNKVAPEVPFRYWAQDELVSHTHLFAESVICACRSVDAAPGFSKRPTVGTHNAVFSAITGVHVMVMESVLPRDTPTEEVYRRFIRVVEAAEASYVPCVSVSVSGEEVVQPIDMHACSGGNIQSAEDVPWLLARNRAVFFRPGELQSFCDRWDASVETEFGVELRMALRPSKKKASTAEVKPLGEVVAEMAHVFRKLDAGDFSAPVVQVHVVPGVARGVVFEFAARFVAFEVFVPPETPSSELKSFFMSFT